MCVQLELGVNVVQKIAKQKMAVCHGSMSCQFSDEMHLLNV